MTYPNLHSTFTRTAAGDSELASPSNGLSINQRKLLQWSDGQASLADMADRLAAGHTVDTSKVARDIERLQAMGLLAGDGAAAAPAMKGPAPMRQAKSRMPMILAGVGVVVVAGGLLAVFGNSAQAPKPLAVATVDGGSQPTAAPEEDTKVFGVMPNPARWFSPSAPKPAEAPAPQAKDVKDAKDAKRPAPAPMQPAKPQQLAAAAPVTQPAPVPAPLPASQAPAAAPPAATTNALKAAQAVAAPALSTPVPNTQPVQVASAQPILPKPVAPPLAAPNTKPIFSVQPDFPIEAMRARIDSGTVKARMSVDKKGNVQKVDVISARPSSVFNRAVVAALSKWRFQPASTRFTVDTEVDFHAAD